MSNGNKLEYEITGDAKGLVAAGKQSETALAGMRKATDQVGAANAASSQAAKDYIAALQREAAQLGMTATQKRVYEAATKGASRADQDAVRTLSDKIEAHGRAEKAMQMVGRAAAIAGAAIGAGLVAVLKGSVTAAQEAEQAMLKLNAVFKASGGASGMTRGELDNMAESMKARTGFDDDKIRDSMSLLLTFRNVGKETFGETMNAAADLSRLLGQDLNSSVTMLGKALENPEQGLTALSRAGVSFSESQKQNITRMVDSGQQAEAMTEILKTLREQGINGVAEAMNTGLFKATNDAKLAWDDLLETIGKTAVVQGSAEAILGSWAGYLSDMKRVIDDGDWLDRLAFFTIGMTTPSMMKGNQWEGSVGGKEAREAREAQERQKQARVGDQRQTFLRGFETPEQKRDRELNNAAHLFAGSPELQPALDAVRKKYADKGGSKGKPERGIDDEDDVLYRIQESARLKNKKAFDEGDRAVEREAAAMETLRKRYVDMADPLQKYRMELDDINKLRDAGLLSAEQAIEATWRVNESMDEAAKKMLGIKEVGQDAFGGLTDAIENWGNKAADTFADFVVDGKASFSDLINSMLKDIARLQAKKILDPITKGAGDWLGDVLGKGAASLFGGSAPAASQGFGMAGDAGALLGFAGGGDHRGGYRIVGERGPEIEATGPSRIFNADQTREILGGGGDAAPNVVVQVINQSGQPLAAKPQGAPQFNGADWVLGVVVDAMQTNPQFRSAFQGR